MSFWVTCALIGLVAGTLGGLLGVGGGIIMVPAFLNFLGISERQAVGTSMAVIFFTAIAAASKHYQQGNVDLRIVVPVALLSMIGAWYIGAPLTSKLPGRTLRMIFAAFLVVTAADMFWKAWKMDAATSSAPPPPAVSGPGAGR